MDINTNTIPISNIVLQQHPISILRLDSIHPTVSGNKWFKLKYNLQDAVSKKASCIITHGGPFSNHLHATAFACKQLNIPCIGLVNGKETYNQTLQDCEAWGMELHFIGYANKQHSIENFVIQKPNSYYIPMGGDNELGQKGAQEILGEATQNYSHIVCSIGTGTTVAGILQSAQKHQQIIGIAAIIDDTVQTKLEAQNLNQNFTLFNNYTHGGFAKVNDNLLQYIIDFKNTHHIALDAVYTGKMMFALDEILQSNYFGTNSKILCIHSGGLQGNAGFGLDVYN